MTGAQALITLFGCLVTALLSLLLGQIVGMRNDLRDLSKVVNDHSTRFAVIEKVFQLNGCENPDGCRR